MIVVIGAGVVGLATALSLLQKKRDVVVLERHRRPGLGASTHNSGVIHAGLYYPPGSLKAMMCVEGRERLKAFCAAHAIAHHVNGKFIVATEGSEEPALARIAENAAACGVRVEDVGRAFLRVREPHVFATRALWSPESGWLEAESYVRALHREVHRLGGHVLPGSLVQSAGRASGCVEVVTSLETIEAEGVVNAAGLFADDIAASCDGEALTIYPCRGEYAQFTDRASHLVHGLVYPVPHSSGHGLGVHFARTSSGTVTIGPTIRYQSRKDDYESDREPVEAFLAPVQRMVPNVHLGDLRLGGTGIRAKLHPPSEKFADFMIRQDAKQPWLFHAAGIDSPGLTSSLAIGERIADLVADALG